MATEFSNIDFKFRYGTRAAMKATSILNGSFNICTDTGDIYVDINDNRYSSNNIISGYTEAEVRALADPGDDIYYTSDSYELMMYNTATLSWIAFGQTVEQANCDGSGNNIINTYATKTALSSLSTVVSNINSFDIIILSSTESLPEVGVDHTIYFVPYTDGDADTAYTEYIYLSSSSTYEKLGITTADLTQYYTITQTDNAISTAVSTAKTTIEAEIPTNYIKGLSAAGTSVTYTKGDNTTGTITTQDTTYSTGTSTTAGLTKLYTSSGTNTDGAVTQSYVTSMKSSIDTLLASKLDATATAAAATMATNDVNSKPLTSYIKSATGSGSTITLTAGDGTTTAITLDSTSTGDESTSGTVKLYTGTGSNTDGSINQAAETTLLAGKSDTTHTHSQYVTADGSVAYATSAGKAALCTGKAVSAISLTTSRNISISGGVTGTATAFDGSADIDIPVTAVDASYIDGTFDYGDEDSK